MGSCISKHDAANTHEVTTSQKAATTTQETAKASTTNAEAIKTPATTVATTQKAAVAGKKDFFATVLNRRTIYTLNKNITVSNARIREIVEFAVKHIPSSFNSQSSRTIILFGAHHDKFWAKTKDVLKAMVSEEQFKATGPRIDGFAAGAGTILFFEDQDVVRGMQEKFATYADKFPIYAGHTSGMVQFFCWAALENEGLGCNLQHYNPLVDEFVQQEWHAPKSWALQAQMVFGHPTAGPGEKTFTPIENRVKAFH